MATHAEGITDYVAVAIGIMCVSALAWLVLRGAEPIADFLGVTGMNVMTRIMGFLLICIGVQFIATGLLEGITSEPAMQLILDSVKQTD